MRQRNTRTTAIIFATITGLCAAACDAPATEPWEGWATWGEATDGSPAAVGETDATATGETDADEVTDSDLSVVLRVTPTEMVEELWVRIDEVRVRHETHGWIVVSAREVVVDLLAVDPGLTAQLAFGQVIPGHYEEIRVDIAEAWTMVDGQEVGIDLSVVPSPEVLITQDFDVEGCGAVELSLAWDLGRDFSVEPAFELEPGLALERFVFATGC
jgi:hypothetical protein